MKRFTETTKWGDPWFMDLPVKYKAFWFYICDQCDCAGTWEPNMRLAIAQIGEPLELVEILRVFAGRIEQLKDGKLWVRKFIEFQYGILSPDCKPHLAVIKRLECLGIKTSPSKGYLKGIHTLQEKEKDKEKEKKGECEGVLGGSFLTGESLRVFNEEWIPVRKAMGKKPKDWQTMFLHQAKWLSQFNPSDQLEIMSKSIRNNYQGLCEPNHSGQSNQPQMSPKHRENKINHLNERKQKINRLIKDPKNPPEWAIRDLGAIDEELKTL